MAGLPVPPIPSLEHPALQELATRVQWVCWRYETRNGKPTKVPMRGSSTDAKGVRADSMKRVTWDTFEHCVATAAKYGWGVGYVFDDDIVGIDLDKCRDPETGKVEPWAQAYIDDVASYTELSPSGCGFHILSRAVIPEDGRKTGQVECYRRGRFFTVTGALADGCVDEIADSTEAVERFWRANFGIPATGMQPRTNGHAPHDGPPAQAPAGYRPDLPGPHLHEDANGTWEPIDPMQMPWEQHAAALENDPKYAKTWKRTRTDREAWSNSEYEMGIISYGMQWGLTDAQIAALALKHRETHGDADKLIVRPKLVWVAITKARAKQLQPTDRAKIIAMARDMDADVASTDQVLAMLRLRLKAPRISAFVKLATKDDTFSYVAVLDDGTQRVIGTPDELLDQRRTRGRLVRFTCNPISTVKEPVWLDTYRLIDSCCTVEDSGESDPRVRLLALIEEYIERTQPKEWGDENGAEAFRLKMPLIYQGSLLIHLGKLFTWAFNDRMLGDWRLADVETLLREAGCRVHMPKLTRKIDGKTICRSYWKVRDYQ
jgi:hypothetical protein